MSDLLAYSFGGAIGEAAIFFPITFIAMRSQVRFRSGLSTAWRPFFYVVLLLTIANAIETGSGSSPPVTTLPGFFLFLLVPIAVSAAVLFVTFRQKRGRIAPANAPEPRAEMAAPDAEKMGAEIIDATLDNDPAKASKAVRKAQPTAAPATRTAPQVDLRRLMLVVAATAAALMLLFPPFHVVWQGGSGNFATLGYSSRHTQWAKSWPPWMCSRCSCNTSGCWL